MMTDFLLAISNSLKYIYDGKIEFSMPENPIFMSYRSNECGE
jgi:hypothetical protein